MKKIIISGSEGFVGKHLIYRFSKNKKIRLIKMNRKFGDIKKKYTWRKLVSADVLIHLAGQSFVPKTWENPNESIRSNVLGTVRALDYCRMNNTKMIFISSYMYGNTNKFPTNEKSKIKINNPLALSKAMAEEFCKFYAKNYKIKTIILRPSNIYGPGQKDFFLIPQIIKKFKSKKIVINNINIKRDLIYVDDFIEAIVKSVSLQKDFEIFNIGSGKSYSINEIVKILKNYFGKNFYILNKNINRKNEILQTKLDIGKAKRILKWKPRWNLKKGLKYTVRK